MMNTLTPGILTRCNHGNVFARMWGFVVGWRHGKTYLGWGARYSCINPAGLLKIAQQKRGTGGKTGTRVNPRLSELADDRK